MSEPLTKADLAAMRAKCDETGPGGQPIWTQSQLMRFAHQFRIDAPRLLSEVERLRDGMLAAEQAARNADQHRCVLQQQLKDAAGLFDEIAEGARKVLEL